VSGLLSAGGLRNTVLLSIPLKKNSPTDRLKEGEEAAAELVDGRRLTVQAVREFARRFRAGGGQHDPAQLPKVLLISCFKLRLRTSRCK
jgi:hypothetical protein